MKTITTPAKYAGQWIAWNQNHTKIIANGKTIVEVEREARKKTEKFWLDKVPSVDQFYGGAATLQ